MITLKLTTEQARVVRDYLEAAIPDAVNAYGDVLDDDVARLQEVIGMIPEGDIE